MCHYSSKDYLALLPHIFPQLKMSTCCLQSACSTLPAPPPSLTQEDKMWANKPLSTCCLQSACSTTLSAPPPCLKQEDKMWANKPLLFTSLLVFAVSFLSYWSSLDGKFVFDDHRGILTNDDLDPSKTSLWEVFQHDFWGGFMSRKESHKSYRPLTILTYRYLNFQFSGLEPYGYHLVNVLFHCLASVSLLLQSRCIIGTGKSLHVGLQWDWNTYAALLFAVHSIHTEAVSF